MKRILRSVLSVLLFACIAFSLCGCSLLSALTGGDSGITVSVTFVTDAKEETVSVPFGEVVSPPKTPKAEDRIFSGWYTDEALKNEYDFSTPVLTNLTLYAGFVLDGAAITNEITLSVMPALVTVENVHPTAPGREAVAQGSGFLYKIENGRAFVLTNCHVVYAAGGTQTITVKDFQGEEYTATLYRKNLFSAPAISADYDLAVITFPYSGDTLKTIPFATADAVEGDEVISLGSPANQSHAITFGEMLDLLRVDLSDSSPEESNVNFDVIYHTAAITNGSSGGPLLNGDLRLVGVNYAGTAPEEGESFGKGCAVPLSKVLEFLSLYE